MLTVLFFTGLCALRNLGVQAALTYNYEEVKVVTLDPIYFDTEKTEIHLVKNETTGEVSFASTFTVIKTPPTDTEAHLWIIEMAKGQYDHPTGIDVTMKLCDMFDDPVIMAPLMTGLGLSQDTCPPEPGTYSQDWFSYPVENLLNQASESKYLIQLSLGLNGKASYLVQLYVNVKNDE